MKFLFVFIAVVLMSGCSDYSKFMFSRAKDVKEKADTVKSIIEGIDGTIVEEEATTTE
jgi:uncharacterized protein YceK